MRAIRSLLLCLLLSVLSACGRAPGLAAPTIAPPAVVPLPTHTAPPAPDQAAASALPVAAATATAAPAFLPEQRVSIRVNGRIWRLTQPVGVAPLAAQGSAGILWIAFPQMRVAALPAGDGIPRPLDAYFVMYTPLTPPGDDLDAGYRIATLPNETDDEARSLVALTPIDQNRFLLVSRRLCAGCQNGGTLEFWRVDPAQAWQPEAFVSLLELPGDGGGHFLTFASGPRWLLWSAADISDLDPAAPARRGEVHLLDLQTGRSQSITIEQPYGAEQAEWTADGRFLLTMRQTDARYLVDPNSGGITPAASS